MRGLGGELSIASIAGWGSILSIRLPLDPPDQPDGLNLAEPAALAR